MLKEIPASAISLARDGVIPAKAVDKATCVEALEKAARRRIARQVSAAQTDMEVQREQALMDGYASGLAAALGDAVPALLHLLHDVDVARAKVLQEASDTLAAAFAASDMEVALVKQCLDRYSHSGSRSIRVYLPTGKEELRTALEADPALAGIDMLEGEAPFPVIDFGGLVLRLESATTYMPQVQQLSAEAFDMQTIEARAKQYAASVQRRLQRPNFIP